MSKRKREREQLALIEQDLRMAGVQTWSLSRTTGNHLKVDFYRDGKPLSFVFSGSTDHMARLRNRSLLRGLLRRHDAT